MDRCDGPYAAGSTTSAKHSGSIASHASLGQLPHHAGQVEEPPMFGNQSLLIEATDVSDLPPRHMRFLFAVYDTRLYTSWQVGTKMIP